MLIPGFVHVKIWFSSFHVKLKLQSIKNGTFQREKSILLSFQTWLLYLQMKTDRYIDISTIETHAWLICKYSQDSNRLFYIRTYTKNDHFNLRKALLTINSFFRPASSV